MSQGEGTKCREKCPNEKFFNFFLRVELLLSSSACIIFCTLNNESLVSYRVETD